MALHRWLFMVMGLLGSISVCAQEECPTPINPGSLVPSGPRSIENYEEWTFRNECATEVVGRAVAKGEIIWAGRYPVGLVSAFRARSSNLPHKIYFFSVYDKKQTSGCDVKLFSPAASVAQYGVDLGPVSSGTQAKVGSSGSSYWGLSGGQVFLAFQTRPPQGGRAPDTLPIGGRYVTNPIVVTGTSEQAVLQRLNQAYRTTDGLVVYVNEPAALRDGRFSGPKDMGFGVLPKTCGAGYVANLIDGSGRTSQVGHAGMGFGRIVSIGCGGDPSSAMRDALEDCFWEGGCTVKYSGQLEVMVEVAFWDGKKVGALVGGRGAADNQASYSGIGGCAYQSTGGAPVIGPLIAGGPITASLCRSVLQVIR
jgi:hypothetical protein